MFRDDALCRDLTEHAYRDLIASGTYSYRRFIECFDEELTEAGFDLGVTAAERRRVSAHLYSGLAWKRALARAKGARFPGRSLLKCLAHPIRRVLSKTTRGAF